MPRLLIVVLAPIAAITLVACFGGSAKVATPASPRTPVSPPAFATAFDPNPPTPNAATATSMATIAALAAPGAHIVGFSFVTPNEGWVLTPGWRVLHTTDGGVTWQTQYDGTATLSAIQFIDPMHGWVSGSAPDAACDARTPVAACHGASLSTSNGGATWHTTSPSPLPITAVHFVDANDGWALASSGFCDGCPRDTLAVIHSRDGGRSWTQTTLVDAPHQAKVEFPEGYDAVGRLATFSASRALVVTSANAYITDDAGATWSKGTSPCAETLPPKAPGIAELAALPDGNVWATCKDFSGGGGMLESILYHSADAGSTWSLIANYAVPQDQLPPNVGEFPGGDGDLQFVDDEHGWYASDDPGSRIFSTSDGGHHWSQVRAPFTTIRYLQFTDPGHGFIATEYGSAARTTDGGAHWTLVRIPK